MKMMKPQEKGSLKARVLRLLRTNISFEESSSDREETVHVAIPANNHYGYWKERETALLEAERKKAQGLMEWQKRRFIY